MAESEQLPTPQESSDAALPPCSAFRPFASGDLVKATVKIWRVDRKAELEPGQTATVRHANPVRGDHQVVDITLPCGRIMGDIVVRAGIPLVHADAQPGYAPSKPSTAATNG